MQNELGFATIDDFGVYSPRIPEHSLLLAIVERAVLDYVGPANTPMQHRRSAETFFRSTSTEKWSFNWIARNLPFEPEWFKRRVMTYVKQQKAMQSRQNVALLNDA